MNDGFAQFLQLMLLAVWNLFPNGTMLIASWLFYHWPPSRPEDVDEEDDFWIPHLGH